MQSRLSVFTSVSNAQLMSEVQQSKECYSWSCEQRLQIRISNRFLAALVELYPSSANKVGLESRRLPLIRFYNTCIFFKPCIRDWYSCVLPWVWCLNSEALSAISFLSTLHDFGISNFNWNKFKDLQITNSTSWIWVYPNCSSELAIFDVLCRPLLLW